MKHPVFYIVAGTLIAVFLLAVVQFVSKEYAQPVLWIFLIPLLIAAMISLAVSMLLYARRINPQMKWLPPPFRI